MLMEQRNELNWAFSSKYMDSRGNLFQLRTRKAADRQTIVDDAPADYDQLSNEVQAAMFGGDWSALAKAQAEMDHYNATARGRTKFTCNTCGDSMIVRSETVQQPLTTAYRGGVRELTLKQLRRVL